MKKAFTLIEIVIVLVVISILMTATMKFGSNRIDDLKAQSLKEQFVWYYNDLYRQNLMSSFRDETKYQTLTLTFQTGTWYRIDATAPVKDPKLADVIFSGLTLDTHPFPSIDITLVPYILWCTIAWASTTWSLFSFQLYIPQNGKQYCFEIKAETCKLVEIRCN